MPMYSEEFKSRMVQRLTERGAPSAAKLGEEVGVSHSTLSAWLRHAQNRGRMKTSSDSPSQPTTPTSVATTTPTSTPSPARGPRSPQEQLRILVEAQGLSGDALGALLRKEGVHAAELESWRSAVLEALVGRAPAPPPSAAERRRIAELERELARKEKALAETAALLVLRKKVQEYLEGEDELTPTRSGR